MECLQRQSDLQSRWHDTSEASCPCAVTAACLDPCKVGRKTKSCRSTSSGHTSGVNMRNTTVALFSALFMHTCFTCLLWFQVADMLERPTAWPRFQNLGDLAALKAELQAFLKQQGLPQDALPPPAALRDAGRQELLNAINQAGVCIAT